MALLGNTYPSQEKSLFGFLCLIYDPILNRIIITGQSDPDNPYASYDEAEQAMLVFAVENSENVSMRPTLLPINVVYKQPLKHSAPKSFEPVAYKWVVVASIAPFNEQVIIAQSPKGVNYGSYSNAYDMMSLAVFPDLPIGSTLLKTVIPLFPHPKRQQLSNGQEQSQAPQANQHIDPFGTTKDMSSNDNVVSPESTIDEIIKSVIEEVMKEPLTSTFLPTSTTLNPTSIPAENNTAITRADSGDVSPNIPYSTESQVLSDAIVPASTTAMESEPSMAVTN